MPDINNLLENLGRSVAPLREQRRMGEVKLQAVVERVYGFVKELPDKTQVLPIEGGKFLYIVKSDRHNDVTFQIRTTNLSGGHDFTLIDNGVVIEWFYLKIKNDRPISLHTLDIAKKKRQGHSLWWNDFETTELDPNKNSGVTVLGDAANKLLNLIQPFEKAFRNLQK